MDGGWFGYSKLPFTESSTLHSVCCGRFRVDVTGRTMDMGRQSSLQCNTWANGHTAGDACAHLNAAVLLHLMAASMELMIRTWIRKERY